MSLRLQKSQRSYPGTSFRPRPELHFQEDGSLIIVATPWGVRTAGERSIALMTDLFLSARTDQEITSPFERLTCLTPLGNNLRVCTMLLNDHLFREDNREAYNTGTELFVASFTETELTWIQIGFPNLYLDRAGQEIVPLSVQTDPSMERALGYDLPPLADEILGVEPTSNFMVRSFRPENGDRFILCSRSQVPGEFYKAPQEARTLDGLSSLLIKNNSEVPFWLSTISFS